MGLAGDPLYLLDGPAADVCAGNLGAHVAVQPLCEREEALTVGSDDMQRCITWETWRGEACCAGLHFPDGSGYRPGELWVWWW